MRTALHKATWTCAGPLLALACAMPAVADETGLLPIDPDASQRTPNVMFDIHSSGRVSENEADGACPGDVGGYPHGNRVEDRKLSFAAPAVAVNAFDRTQNLNDVYVTTFGASERPHRAGKLEKYRIAGGKIVDRGGRPAGDPNTGSLNGSAAGFWTAGVGHLPAPAARRIYTNISANPDLAAGANALAASNAGSFVAADFGLTGADGEPSIEELIRRIRGKDLRDGDPGAAAMVTRKAAYRLHSQPAAVVYGGSEAGPDVIVFAAINQGSVHAFNASTGEELWSFMPKEHLEQLALYYVDNEAPSGVVGDIVPVVADRDNDGVIEPGDGDFVYIIFGLGRGGNVYYALDVTDRGKPVVKWRLSAPGFGQTWSRPTVARVDMADPALNKDKAVVILGGGYDTVHDDLSHPAMPDTEGAGIYMVDLQSGDILWRAGADAGANLQIPGMTRSVAADIRVIDLDTDQYADRMYAADVGGQVLRFDIFRGQSPDGSGADALVTGGVVAQLGAMSQGSPTDADTRRFFAAPDVSIFNDDAQNRRFVAISIGSGDRAHPSDNTSTDRFYSIRDVVVSGRMTQAAYDALTPVTEADLVEINGTVGKVPGPEDRGWKFTLPPDQKVFANSVTFNDEIFFVAFSPDTATACEAGGGRNYLYRVAVANGGPVMNLDTIVPGGEDRERMVELAQGGIAPPPAFLFPGPDPGCTGEECSPPPIGCVGAECFDPGFENLPVRTVWTEEGVE